MYISDLKRRKWIIRLSIVFSVFMILLTNGFHMSYRTDLRSSAIDIPFIGVKLTISLFITIAVVFFTFRTLQKN